MLGSANGKVMRINFKHLLLGSTCLTLYVKACNDMDKDADCVVLCRDQRGYVEVAQAAFLSMCLASLSKACIDVDKLADCVVLFSAQLVVR